MLTSQKAASGTGSQNVPASPRRPVLKDKGRQRKCLYIKCRLGTNTFTSNSETLRRAQTSFLSSEDISIFSPQRAKRARRVPQRHEQDLRHSMCSWLFQQPRFAMPVKGSFWLPDLYQHRALLNIFNVKMHVYWYQWKDGENLPEMSLGIATENSSTSQAYPHGAQSKSSCQKSPPTTKICA